MFNVEFSYEEREVLRQILQNALGSLELEIQHTDYQEFRNMLRQRRDIIKGLLAKLPQPMSVAA